MAKYHSPRATRDFLPAQAAARNHVAAAFARVAESYGYRPIQTPIYEAVELFLARSGPEVKSSMLTFHADHEEFALRPEMTAPVCRLLASGAFAGAPPPYRLHYVGPCFRYCRPQSGRYREFTQAGIECLGAAGPAADAEVIAAACSFLRAVGIPRFSLKIGTSRIFRELLGAELDPEDQAVVIGHLDHLIAIDEKCALLAQSPDQALLEDLKMDRMDLASMQAEAAFAGPYAIAARPQLAETEIAERLPLEAEATFRRVWSAQELVSETTADLLIRASRLRGPLDKVHQQAASLLAGTPATAGLEELLTVARHVAMYNLGDFEVVLGIARGFTFYTSTVFEISAGNGAGGAKYCGGGRYDRLVEEFGGPPLPSTGCGFRFDDIVEAFVAAGQWKAPRDYQLVLLAASEPTLSAAVSVAEQLRAQGLRVGVETAAAQSPTAADLEKHKTEWIGTVEAAPSATPSAATLPTATPSVRLTNGSTAEELPLKAEVLIGRLGSPRPS
jgi:histidyl-tRNA synthetase